MSASEVKRTLLTFKKDSLVDIKEGRKYTTIRAACYRWREWWENPSREYDLARLQIYGKSPRTGGKMITETTCTNVELMRGEFFTTTVARADGFVSVHQLAMALADVNKISMNDIPLMTWAVISFDPHPIQNALGALLTTYEEYLKYVTRDGRLKREKVSIPVIPDSLDFPFFDGVMLTKPAIDALLSSALPGEGINETVMRVVAERDGLTVADSLRRSGE